MSSVRNVVLSGAIAAIIAIGLIVAVVFVPGVGLGVGTSSSTAISPTGIQSSQSTQSSSNIQSSQSNGGQSSSTTSSLSGQGNMAVLLTDPPTVPENVSAVYMQYSEVQAHIASALNQTGWYDLTGSGEINLMSVVNVSQTIANQTLPQGEFNGLRFNVTSVSVTYESQNYPAQMVNGHNTLYVWIPGGINVTAAQTTAALIDLSPAVLLVGNSSSPAFVFVPAAVGYVIPTTSIPAQSHVIGGQANLTGNSWWMKIEQGTHFEITGTTLTPDSLRITIANTGTTSIVMRLAAITTQATLLGGIEGQLRTSAIFVVEENGSLVNLNTSSVKAAEAQVAAGGLLLAPGQNITLHYSGTPIEIGEQVGMMMSTGMHMTYPGEQPIAVGSMYHAWVQGDAQIAQFAVNATSG